MLSFSKYQGLGNDFIILEGNQKYLPQIVDQEAGSFVRKACDRRYGIGADGLILVQPAKSNADIRMQIINKALKIFFELRCFIYTYLNHLK